MQWPWTLITSNDIKVTCPTYTLIDKATPTTPTSLQVIPPLFRFMQVIPFATNLQQKYPGSFSHALQIHYKYRTHGTDAPADSLGHFNSSTITITGLQFSLPSMLPQYLYSFYCALCFSVNHEYLLLCYTRPHIQTSGHPDIRISRHPDVFVFVKMWKRTKQVHYY